MHPKLLSFGISLGLVLSLLSFAPFASPPGAAIASDLKLCRSIAGDGVSLETDKTKNGFFVESSLRVEPIYAKRLYADIRAGYDAAYIGYRITNTSSSPMNNLWISLDSWAPTSVVQLARLRDGEQRIGTLAANTTVTKFFLIKATGYSELDQTHAVRIWEGTPGSTQRLACAASLEGVQRSIAARANKVTSIVSSPSPTLGGDLTITVTGAPGTVGAGNVEDGSAMTLSPTNYSAWPTNALELRSLRIVVTGFKNSNEQTPCVATNYSRGVSQVARAQDKIPLGVIFQDELVLRDFSKCAISPKSAYTIVYTFKVTGALKTNPTIVPVSDISSGTQIKYTGGYPSTTSEVSMTSLSVPSEVSSATVGKSYVAGSASIVTGGTSKLRLSYRLTAGSSADLTLDQFWDNAPPNATFVSATFSDQSRTDQPISAVTEGSTAAPVLRFLGPFSITESIDAVITYTIEVPFISGTNSYSNSAYGLFGSYVVGSGANAVQEISLAVPITGEGTIGEVTVATVAKKLPQTITFQPPATLGEGTSITLDGFSDGGLPLSYSVSNSSSCVVSQFAGAWTLTMAGETCDVTASQAGDTQYEPAASVTRTIVGLPGQSISYTPASLTDGTTTTKVVVESTSKLEVVVVNLTPEECSLVLDSFDSVTGESTFTVTALKTGGSCILSASQPGDENFGAAPDVDIVIGIGKGQFLSFLGLPSTDLQVSSPPETKSTVTQTTLRSVSYQSGTVSTKTMLPVTLTSLTPTICTVLPPPTADDGSIGSDYNSTTGETLTAIKLVSAGECRIQADQDGYTDAGVLSAYAVATPATYSVTVRPSGTLAQQLSLTLPASKTYGDSVFSIQSDSRRSSDSALTNLLVTMASTTPAVCEVGPPTLTSGISSAQLVLHSAGLCEIRANQGGNATYSAATPKVASFTVNPRSLTITGLTIPSREYNGGTAVAFTGTAGLDGVLPGDGPAEVALDGTPSAVLASPNVGTQTVTVAGFGLQGSKIAGTPSYTLSPLTLNAVITTRAISLTAVNQTVGSGDTPEPCSVSVGGSGIAEGDDLGTLSCGYGNYATDNPPNSSYAITIDTYSVTRAGQNASSNYAIDIFPGTLTVTTLIVPDLLQLDTITLVYGEDLPQDELDKPRAVKSNSEVVPGTTRHLFNKSELTTGSRLPVGTHNVTVEFIPTDTETTSPTSAPRQIIVTKRPVEYTFTVSSKVYDGSDEATLGDFSLRGLEGDTASGVVTGDDVTLASVPAEGAFASSDVGSGIDVTWTPPGLSGAKAGNYDLRGPSRITAEITRRPVSYTFTISSKVYDGTTTAELSGFALTSVPGDESSGRVDTDDISLASPPSVGEFDSANAGEAIGVSWAPPGLTGAKASNYNLRSPGAKTAAILKRPVTVKTTVYGRLVGETNPAFVVSALPPGVDTGLVEGEDLYDVIERNPSVSVVGYTSDTAGSYPLRPVPAVKSNNYDVGVEDGILHVASMTITASTTGGELEDLEVSCGCENLEPRTSVIFRLFSDPVVLATVTTDDNGDCPLTTGTIPSVPEGPHTLQLDGIQKTSEPGQVTRSITIPASLFQTDPVVGGDDGSEEPVLGGGNGGTGGGSSGGTSNPRNPRTPPPSTNTEISPPAPQSFSPPRGSLRNPAPGTTTQDAGGDRGLGFSAPGNPSTATGEGTGPRSSPREETSVTGGTWRPPGQLVADRGQEPNNTFDLGAPLDTTQGSGEGSGQGSGEGTVSGGVRAGTRTIGELANERVGGFQPGTGLQVEVIGSRTTARFVVSTVSGIDQAVLLEQIRRSMEGNRTDFAGIDQIGSGTGRSTAAAWLPADRQQAADLFDYSRLPEPQSLRDVLGDGPYTWLAVETSVEGYLPGSVIYLTATSSPIVFGQAVVGPDGVARVTGEFPAEVLGVGEHRLRVVGVRVFSDIQVDDAGEVIIPDNVLSEIRQFDLSTDATVIVTGNNALGGVHTVMRVVPLDPIPPWWTLWLIGWTALLISLARLRGNLRTFRERAMGSGLIVVTVGPALYFGWTSTVTSVMWWGLVMALGLSLLTFILPVVRRIDTVSETSPRRERDRARL